MNGTECNRNLGKKRLLQAGRSGKREVFTEEWAYKMANLERRKEEKWAF